jgi:hypothetical protein
MWSRAPFCAMIARGAHLLALTSREPSNNSIDLTEGAGYSTPRFWHKRS